MSLTSLPVGLDQVTATRPRREILQPILSKKCRFGFETKIRVKLPNAACASASRHQLLGTHLRGREIDRLARWRPRLILPTQMQLAERRLVRGNP